MDTRDRLKAWIERSGITQRMAAQVLGLDHTFLNQILSGRRTPSLASAVKIERQTGIMAGAWVPTDEGKPETPVPVDRRKRKSA